MSATPGSESDVAGNAWGMLSFLLAMSPFAIVGLAFAFDAVGDAPEALDRVVYASAPAGGLLAIITGIAGWRRPRHRGLTRVGVVLGMVELAASIAIFIALALALGRAE